MIYFLSTWVVITQRKRTIISLTHADPLRTPLIKSINDIVNPVLLKLVLSLYEGEILVIIP
jgi:hypothetical protein